MRYLRTLVILAVIGSPAYAYRANVYLTWNGAGDGSSCASPLSQTFFNSDTNWDANNPNHIGPGTTVHLCGTWNVPVNTTALTIPAGRGGSAGNILTITFETGAILQSTAFHNYGAININSANYLLIDGGPTCGMVNGSFVACNGTIQNTANGTAGNTHCLNGSCNVTQNSGAITDGYSAYPHTNLEIRNLAMKNIFHRTDPRTSTSGNTSCPSGNACGADTWIVALYHIVGSSNINIHNNDIRNGSECVTIDYDGGTAGIDNVTISNNYCADAHWGIAMAGSTAGNNATHIHIDNNEVTQFTNWITPADIFHCNGTILYNACAAGACSIGDVNSTISGNYIHGDLSGGYQYSSPSGLLDFFQNATGFRVFNNVLKSECASVTNVTCGKLLWDMGGDNDPSGGGHLITNNTFDGNSTMGCIEVNTLTSSTVKNNMFLNCVAALQIEPNNTTQLVADYDAVWGLWEGLTNGAYFGSNVDASGNFLTLAQYQALGQEAHAVTADPKLDANYRPQSGTSLNAGTTITSTGITMNVDKDGNTRTAPWTIGAYQYPSGAVAPTVTTTSATSITTTTASSGGNVTSDGGASVSARGVCYAITANPTTPCTSNGTGTGAFTSSLTGLIPGTLYHYRAYATNSAGTGYGSDLTFTTTGNVSGTGLSGTVRYSGARK